MSSKKWPPWQKKERSSQQDLSLSITSADQPPQTSRNASQTSAASSTVVQQPAPTVHSSPSSLDRVNKHGLFLLNPQTSNVDGVQAEESYLIDIVALHGITGDAYDTWTHKNGKFWLRDFVPEDFPGARVFSFGYDAKVSWSRSKGNIESFARSLLEGLMRERMEEKNQLRRIFFICHSMGGIVVKKALIIARLDANDYSNIADSVSAILFLGTPHRGSGATQLLMMLASIANVALAGTSGFIGSIRTDLIGSLKKDSEELKGISTDFRNQIGNMKIASFIETSTTLPAKTKIVDDISGVMGIPGERVVSMAGCDHRSICRFSDKEGENYQSVWTVLKPWANECMKVTTEEPTAEDLPCLHSLAYPEMTYRRQEADRAHPNTCGWILQHASYKTWMSRERGLLWVKGKPGTGKSTLMAFIYRPFQAVPINERHVYLSFFFHGRGTMLQKTPLGMFRSLLHQLLIRVHSVREPIRKAYQEKMVFGEPGKCWEWQLKELQDLFFNAVASIAGARPITIFIDALDEAGTKAAEELVTYFHRLNDRLTDNSSATKICISCRHYPVVSLIPGLEICVENENRKDISTFVHDQLYSGVKDWERDLSSIKACKELEDALAQKALGVFQWASLVIPMVAKWLNDGESLEDIYQMLAKVPDELSDVYEHILKNVIEPHQYPRALHLMQWVCLAKRPLSVIELRFAMASDDTCIHPSRISCKDAKGFVETDTRMEKLIRSLSGGLAEVEHYESDSIVQFVHQSINDFLLSTGLNFLVSASANALFSQAFKPSMSPSSDEIIGQSENRLSRSCINYLKLGEVLRGDRTWDYRNKKTNKQELPFIDYATKSWFLHAEKAEIRGISQHDLAEQFEFPPHVFETWISIYRSIEEYSNRCPEQGSTLLHIASSSNLQSTVRLLLTTVKSVEEEDGSGNRALHYAARWGHKELTSMLLDAHAEIGPKNSYSSTPLQQAAANDHEEVLRLLLYRGANVNERTGGSGNALQAAAQSGSTTIVRILLRSGAEVNAQDGYYGNALQAAASGGHKAVVQLLLDNGAEVNAQGGRYDNALRAAALRGYKAVIQLLLDKGAEVNAQGGQYGNALQAAAVGGHKAVVHLLLDNGAEVNAQGGQYGNALQAAASCGHKAVVQLLLDNGAEVNAQGGEYGNALRAAASDGHKAVVHLLLDKGAEVNAQGGYYGNALQAAVVGGDKAVVQLLLDNRAEVNAQGGQYSNALQAATFCGDEAVVQLLLDNGAQVNAQGGQYGNALQAAASRGHKNIVKIIIGKQYDINKEDSQGRLALYLAMRSNQQDMIDYLLHIGARLDPTHKDRQGCSALHFAASGGCINALRLTINFGVKVNAPDTNGWTPLHWAGRNGSKKAAQLLIDSGATLESKDLQGRTPFDVAVICNNTSLLSTLGQTSSQHNNVDGRQMILAPAARRWVYCASCFHEIYGVCYKCVDCIQFDLCFRCIVDAAIIHDPNHTFHDDSPDATS